MLARCVATLKPPPELTLSQWADRYRMLSAESSAEPGRWHTDKAPYQREIMDAIGDAHIRRVVIMCAAQLGKTELLLNILGYFMAYAPAPILVMQPTLDMGQTFSKDRLAPMIRDTPVLRGLVDVKSRYAGNTILKKNFPGGHITIVGANSATGLASRPIKVLLADEVDRYPGSAGTEGDPLSLAQKRQTTFWDKKTVMVSTPVIKGHSRIETEYNQSTREEWNVPCPECGHYQPFVWANLIFDPDDLQKEIIYKCERCGCVANEYRWKQQSQQGRFVAENPGAETRGFHLNTLASTFCGWKEIVQKFIVAKEQLDQGNPEGMKVWVNTELGETWEERGEQVEDTELFNRREIYDAVVPEEVLVLTAGVDVQDDRFEVEIVGWGVGKESWGIRYQKIYGDMLKEQVWEDLDAFLQTVWCKKDGTALRIISCCIDSGGHHTDQVYRFTKERYERGVWAIKGKGGAEVPYIRNPTTNNRVKTPLFIIVVNVFGETGGQVFDVFTGKLQGVADFVTGLFSEGGVAAALAPLQNTITNLFGENAGAAFGGVVTILQSVMGVVGQIVTFATGTVKPIIQDVFTFITGTVLPIILQTFTAAAPTIAGIISNIGSAVMTGMQIIGSAIQMAMPIIQGIITVIMTIGSVVVPALLAGFEAFSAGISAVMSAIQGFFQGLITFITGVFSGSWSQAWEGIKQIFGSAFDGLVALCKAPLNAVIAIINKAISGINGLGLTIPEWVPILGGKSFSINIPALPMLAKGGFTDGVSIAGEAGTEAVISFQRGVRSDNINTWTQAGRMLGVSGEQAAVAAGVPYADGGGAVELATIDATQGNNAVELQEIDTCKPQPEQGGGGTPDGGGQVVFAPQIVVQGNADRAVLESVLDDAQQRFELWYEQMMRRKARTAY